MTKRTKIVIGTILVVLLIWLGYSISGTKKPTETGTIKIGLIAPLTGKASNLGETTEEGFLMAFKKLKQQGKNIKVVVEDGGCAPAKATSAYRKLVDIDKIKVIVGPLCSVAALAVSPQAEKDKVIIISPGATAPSLSYAGDYIFRNQTNVKQELSAMFHYLSKKFDYKKVAVIYLKDNDFSVEGEKFLRTELLPKLGMKTVFSEGTFSNTDYRTLIAKIKQSKQNIDVIFIDLLTKDSLNFLKQMKELGLKKPVVANKTINNPEFLDNAGALGEGVIFAEANFDKATNPDFWNKYREKFGREPNIFAAQAYESLILLSEIIENKCPKTNTNCVKDELYKVKQWPGITGLLSVDKNGDFAKNIAIKVVKGGKVSIISK